MNFDPKTHNLFSADPLYLYNFDSTCPEVSKYLNSLALGILVLEKKIFEVRPNFTNVCPLVVPKGPSPNLYNFGTPCPKGHALTKFVKNRPGTVRGDVENVKS